MIWRKEPILLATVAITALILSGCGGTREARETDTERVTPLASGPAPVERVVPREIVPYDDKKTATAPIAESAPTAPANEGEKPAPRIANGSAKTGPPRQVTPPTERKTRYVDATSLNVRSGAGPQANVQDQLPRNATVSVTGERVGTDGANWSKIAYLDEGKYRTGWVSTNYLSESKSSPPARSAPTRAGAAKGSTLKKTSFYKPEGEYFEQFQRLNYAKFPKSNHPGNPQIEAKGVYVSLNVLSSSRFDEILSMVETTELNALVIDFKDDVGWLLTKSPTAARRVPQANAKAKYDDISGLIKRLKAKNIYLIARIVTFKDPFYVRAHPESAIIDSATGKPYKSGDGLAWSSPYDPGFRAYNIGIAKEAAMAGFNEIQFDYVRFPDVSRTATLNYRNQTGAIKADAIQSFLIEARSALAPYGVYVAADVFAWITTAVDDVRIGQYWEAISNVVDYICPMMYPSHYHKDAYGLNDPNSQPYKLVKAGLNDAQARDRALDPPATIRPWLQGFSYTPSQVKAQIRAARELGVTSYLIWHPSGKYNPAAFR